MGKLITLVFRRKWSLFFKTLPFVAFIILSKFVVHNLGYEFLELNTLFGAIISANIFLIGFLISGVLVDYKESEKIPGEMASGIAAMADEGYIILKNKQSDAAKDYLRRLAELNSLIIDWFYKRSKTEELRKKIFDLNDIFLSFESLTQANFISRLKTEQANLRRQVTRAHTIRETSFVGTGYAIAEVITAMLAFGMVFVQINPFYESVFFVMFVSFVLIYMIFFIRDMDNPFGYSEKESLVEEVSLKPLIDNQKRLDSLA